MSWISWTSLVPTLLILSASLAWWFTEPKTARINLIAAAGAALFCWAIAPELCRELSYSAYVLTVDTVSALNLEHAIARHANMLLTGAAVVWLVRRAWQTLWKPVPELINILGVDVPEPPDVSLAEIRADAATVNWTRPPANRSVQKFLIQVNGVDVGEVAANQEPAIVVSGLKPNHFYNVRVIAVNSNNFQAGSRVIRLRTFGRDGRPQLGNSRLPSNFIPEDPRGSAPGEVGDDGGSNRSPFPALEVPTIPEATASPARDVNSTSGSGPRRNTVTRRHSPSTTSLEQPIREDTNADCKQTLPELTEKFEGIRKESEDVLALIAKEEGDNRALLEELDAEKREKRKEQKKKEEQTEKLKRELHSTDRTMRNAMQRKAQKERLLKEKQNERAKLHDNIAKCEKGAEEMRRDRESFTQQMTELEAARDRKLECIRGENENLQAECSRLETELKERREQVKELEEARKMLPGGEEDGDLREKLAEERREWFRRGRGRELGEAQAFEVKRARGLDEQLRILAMQVQHIPQAPYGLYNQPNPSGLEFDPSAAAPLHRRNRASTTMSNVPVSISTPLSAYSHIDPIVSIPTPVGFASSRSANAPPGFAPGPFMDLSTAIANRLDESSARTAPLSPSATALLPSNILADLDDDDEPSPVSRYAPDPFLLQQRASPDEDPQSPASSGRSRSIFSSPHGSSSNLPFPAFQNDISDRLSLHGPGTIPSPVATEPPQNKLSSFFSFQRSRPTKAVDQEGVPLGSLKQGQSQSFPKQTDDPDGLTKRRIGLSGTWNVFNRNSVGPEITEGHMPHSRMFSKSLNPFSSSHRAAGVMFPERDPSSPRPASIASSEFPRPSTDSGSIWGFSAGDVAALGKPSRLWPSDAAPWSRAPSRRPSLHGSPSALKTTLASAEDEILDEEMLPNPSEVGVIGSRPPAQSKPLGRLNPNAPAFIGIFKSKSDKDKEKEKEKEGKEKSKAEKKDKSKAKDSKEKSKNKEVALTQDALQPPVLEMDSPSESRKSRDGFSVHTQTSVSESRDSLSLDMSFSNTLSEPNSAGLSSSFKDENVVRKLFRKGSSGKFSLTGRLGGKESGLFKKAPSSTASGGASDKGTSMERSSIGDLEEIADEALNPSFLGRSYDSITSIPSLAPSVSATKNKESKAPARWLSNFGKKGKKEKESLDLDRAQLSELDGLAEENHKS
ncbi:uncharacterized protein B0T15DRAFT_498599 [Chaetomium strumarium]|uniref:Fibronectin type-III domain-containing protein n=1 Tax=Chaetomium strumarium TaxID=1170767 RepID=A0AAJ0M635_9PEZI|nr:hypothetical protein B0T15DRAFT_498599 [Chaetomium strumarium]